MEILLVVDMLFDFIDKSGKLYIGENAEALIPAIKKRIKKYLDNNDVVIFLCDSHEEDDKEFERFPKHCLVGTAGAMLIPELSTYINDKVIVINKNRYSGFFNTKLEKILFELEPKKVEITGCCTSICVMDTVGELINRDYTVTIQKNCVADFDTEMHKFALRRMENVYGVTII